jgi:predicted nucleic acid-binding protein
MTDPDPARVVADADVLAADLLSGGPAREALDRVRAHSWVDLVASDRLLDDAEAVIVALATEPLAADWRDRAASECVLVDHTADDHPALASAYEGNAAHVLSFDEGVTSAGANLSLRPYVQVSLRTPAAFLTLFDPASLYEAVEGGEYPGPDRDPRS